MVSEENNYRFYSTPHYTIAPVLYIAVVVRYGGVLFDSRREKGSVRKLNLAKKVYALCMGRRRHRTPDGNSVLISLYICIYVLIYRDR